MDPRPDSQQSNVARIAPDPQFQIQPFFRLTNIETEQGTVPYMAEFTDCNDVLQTIPLNMGESTVVCLRYGTVNTNFAYSLVRIIK